MLLIEDLNEKCANCSDKMKERIRFVMVHMKEHKKEDYDKVIAKYPFTADVLKV